MNRALSALLALLLTGWDMSACVNTRYSREEEKQLTGDVVKLIMGQFAHHGAAYYNDQIKTTTRELEADANNVEARNDRAVAYLKLKDYNKAEAEFLFIEAAHPNLYRTQANLGVLYKKIGQFEKAAEHLEKSFTIQPGGHLGLGDYYVRMIRWLDRLEDMRVADDPVNFLNISYSLGPKAVAESPLVNREYIETLIKADRGFADAYVVLGDLLNVAGEKELAYRAYFRARDLGHPFSKLVKERARDIWNEWDRQAEKRPGYIVLSERRLYEQLRKEYRAAENWLNEFEETEANLIADNVAVDFAKVKVAMTERGIVEPKYIFGGVVKGTSQRLGDSRSGIYLLAGVIFFFALVGMIATVIYLVKWVRRRFAAV